MLKNRRTSRTKWLDIFLKLIKFPICFALNVISSILTGWFWPLNKVCREVAALNWYLIIFLSREVEGRGGTSLGVLPLAAWYEERVAGHDRAGGRDAQLRVEERDLHQLPGGEGGGGGGGCVDLALTHHPLSSNLHTKQWGLTLKGGKRGRKKWQILSTEWPFQS